MARAARFHSDVRDWDGSPRKDRGAVKANLLALAVAEAEAEAAFERRAAFGPGESIVNILTGEVFYT